MSASPSAPGHESLLPSPWMVRFAHLVTDGARVLDVASGHGRHARFFAGRGCRVLAIDRDAGALASLSTVPGIETAVIDLEGEAWPLAGECFDAIVVANYLHRPLLPHLLTALAADGALLYETFARGNEVYGRPSNPAFLLEPGELLRIAQGRLEIVAFEEGRIARQGRDAVVQRIAAVGLRRARPLVLPSADLPA